jgi:hypothetical protein
LSILGASWSTVSIHSITGSSPESRPKPFIVAIIVEVRRLHHLQTFSNGDPPATGQDQIRDTRERIRTVVVCARNVIDTVFSRWAATPL